VNGWLPPPLPRLAPDEAGAVPLLTEFQREHPGVRIVRPHYADEPWRALIDEGSVPGDIRASGCFVSAAPRALLGRLEGLFSRPG
jgi:hypothetical protein